MMIYFTTGLGIALSIYMDTLVWVRILKGNIEDEEYPIDEFHSSRSVVLIHHMALLRAALSRKGLSSLRFSVGLYCKSSWPSHCGLGSTSSAVLGLYHGVNAALNNPFTDEELRLLLAFNYVEEEGIDRVKKGFETSMTATGAHGGGIYVLSESTRDRIPVLARNNSEEVLSKLKVFVVTPLPDDTIETFLENEAEKMMMKEKVDMKEEEDVLLEGAVSDGLEEVCKLKKEAFDRILENVGRGNDIDIDELGREVELLQSLGGKKVEIEKQKEGKRIVRFLDAMSAIRSQNTCSSDGWKVSIAGMSSVGPAVCVICSPLEAIDEGMKLSPQSSEMNTIGNMIQSAAHAQRLVVSYDTGIGLNGGKQVMSFSSAAPLLVSVQGMPGAGKTTLCEQLVGLFADRKDVRVVHVPVGKLIKEFMANKSSLPADPYAVEVLKDIVTSGEVEDRHFITSKLVLQTLMEHLHKSQDCNTRCVFLLDGFPRSAQQARDIRNRFGLHMDMWLILSQENTVRHERIRQRRMQEKREQDPESEQRDCKDETDRIIAELPPDAVIHYFISDETLLTAVAVAVNCFINSAH